ncbi:MAG: hypothetical protein RMK20_00635 [Verrucomicrobiales bacterium]|nr:hypothetical protein [Verrucomicrobiales bacterium]
MIPTVQRSETERRNQPAKPSSPACILLNPEVAGRPLRRPWKNGIAVGRAHDLLRADLCEHLRWLQQEIGFRACRFHAVFHDEMAVARRRSDGSLAWQWCRVDQVYDRLLGLGLKPFVELNPMPAALASGSQTMFHYAMNVTPPRSWREWHDLVRAFTAHCVERYGLPEVRQWHFEVWNEPNLPCFWTGTQEDYFQLYAHAARAVKSVDAQLRVGGPATARAAWLTDLIEFCARQGVPLDFISTHLYPQDEFAEAREQTAGGREPGTFFAEQVQAVRRAIASSVMPHLPVHWTEWNTQLAASAAEVSWTNNRFVDSLPGAAFVVRNMTELDEAADSFFYWVASDIFEESPLPHAPFSHTYGLLTIHGIPKATANAFRLLERMRGPRIAVEHTGPIPTFCGAVATREGESIQVLLWHDVPPGRAAAATWRGVLKLARPRDSAGADQWVATTSHIRSGAGSAFEAWEALGRPETLSPVQLKYLRQCAEPAMESHLLKVHGTYLEFPFALAAHEVLHLEFRPQAAAAEDRAPAEAASREELEARLSGKTNL